MINKTITGSNLKKFPLISQCYEYYWHFKMRMRDRGLKNIVVSGLDSNIAEYEHVFLKTSGRSLAEASIVEVGFGARPLRMFWLRSHGYNVHGVDLDFPILKGSLAEFRSIFLKNGVHRLLKSIVRYFIFDKTLFRHLDEILRVRGRGGLLIEADRFVVKAAEDVDFRAICPGGIDFIFSEDVFEHISKNKLEELLKNLSTALAPDGCALFRPHIFSSIGGGHLPEWYPHLTRQRSPDSISCRSEPWEHLRKRRFKANTYLNELRIKEYRKIISEHFEILSEENSEPDLGSKFLSRQIMTELADYAKEELLLNNVRFICAKRKGL